MAMQGDLADVGLPNILQMLCMERRSVALLVKRQHEDAAVYFEGGEIVHAALGGVEGEEAVYGLLAWPDGTFRLDGDTPAPARTINRPWNQVLLEGLGQLDEKRSAEAVPAREALTAEEQERDLRLSLKLLGVHALLRRELAALAELRSHWRPEAGLAILERMVNLVVKREESLLSPDLPEVSLAKALLAVIDQVPQARLFHVHRNRLSAYTVANFYKGASTNPSEREHLAREAWRAGILLLERLLSALGQQLRSRETGEGWRQVCRLFLLDLGRMVETFDL
jgi:Domain of unknown function (DUF4388)